MFDLRKGHLDGVRVGAVGRNEDDATTSGREKLDDLGVLVKSEVVHHDDLAGAQRRAENAADEVEEMVSLHATLDDRVATDPANVHGGDEREALAARVRLFGPEQALPSP